MLSIPLPSLSIPISPHTILIKEVSFDSRKPFKTVIYAESSIEHIYSSDHVPQGVLNKILKIYLTSLTFHILKDNVVGEVCGFCGLSSCVGKSKLIRSNKNKGQQYIELDSSCPYFFSYSRRPQLSKRNKCSNYLSRCDAANCEADVWKYHMAEQGGTLQTVSSLAGFA